MPAATSAQDPATDSDGSYRWPAIAARVGLGSRAIVYLTLAVLVLQLATGDRRRETDQASGIRVLGATPAGDVVLVVLVVGVAFYTAWRWTVAFAPSRNDTGRRDRLLAFVEGAGYLPFAYMGLAVLFGDSQAADQGSTYRSLSGQLMQHLAGRLLVGAVGVVIVIVGAFLGSQGVRRSFLHDMHIPERPRLTRPATAVVGVAGSVGRGVVFALAGALAIYAAVTADASKAGGIDAALDTVTAQPYGTWLLVLAAISFAAFALLAVAEGLWRDVSTLPWPRRSRRESQPV